MHDLPRELQFGMQQQCKASNPRLPAGQTAFTRSQLQAKILLADTLYGGACMLQGVPKSLGGRIEGCRV